MTTNDYALQWQSWGQYQAVATGLTNFNNCIPDCAAGTITIVAVTITHQAVDERQQHPEMVPATLPIPQQTPAQAGDRVSERDTVTLGRAERAVSLDARAAASLGRRPRSASDRATYRAGLRLVTGQWPECTRRQRLVPFPRRQQPGQVLPESPPLRHTSKQVIKPRRIPL